MTGGRHDVAIIGAGFTGTCVAAHLLRDLPAGARLALVGRRPGPGLAYGTDAPDHVLNVPAGRMSLFADQPDHFLAWLARRDAAPGAADFVARGLYGRYLEDSLAAAAQVARARIALAPVAGEAVALQPDGQGRQSIHLADGRTLSAAVVVLCLGNSPAALPLPQQAVDRAALPRIIVDPWSDRPPATIAPDAAVLLIGTGLTMVDQVLTLAGAGHRGPLTALSRHGLLPAAHADPMAPPRPVRLPEAPASLRRLVRRVVAEVRAEQAAGGDWRAVVDGLRPATQSLWQGLAPADQERFLRHVAAPWSVHRHRMAPAAARRIAALRESGQLSLVAARLTGLWRHGGDLVAVLRPRGHRRLDLRCFDWAINCSGLGCGAGLARQPLVADALVRGLLQLDRFRLGLAVTAEGRTVGAGGINREIFAAGPITAGRFFEITAVREIRDQAAATSRRVVGALRQRIMAEHHSARIVDRSNRAFIDGL